MAARSYLFVPGNAPDKLEKAWTRGADALIVDLEDAVPRAAEHAARGTVTAWLGAQVDAPGEIWVRVNNHPGLFETDISALADSPVLTGIVLPKVHDAAQVGVVRALLDGAATGQCGLLVMVETARALVEVNAIAAMPGVSALMLGEYDLAADLGMEPDWRGSELHHARAATVVACVAADISPPVGAVSANITDLVRFAETTRPFEARRLPWEGGDPSCPDSHRERRAHAGR